MSKDHNTITCTHGKGLACPVCYDQTHSLENSEFVVDPFDTYEQHELPPDLSQCGDACNCMKCRDAHTVKVIDDHMALNPFPPSKSSCIALRASQLNIEVIDQPALATLEPEDLKGIPVRVGDSLEFLPPVERFKDLPDGTLFYLAQTYAYGGRQKYQKVLEDGGLHNAVLYTDSYSGMRVPDMKLVIRV